MSATKRDEAVLGWRHRLKRNLSKKLWQGIGGVAGVLSAVLGLIGLMNGGAPNNATLPETQVNTCVLQGNENTGNALTCYAVRLQQPTAGSPTPFPSPTQFVTGGRPIDQPVDKSNGGPVSPVPVGTSPSVRTGASPSIAVSEAAQDEWTFPTTDFPIFIGLYGPGAKQVDGQGPADFQVEAAGLSPLNGAKAATADAGKTCVSVDYSTFGVKFDVMTRPSICVLSRLGTRYLVQIEPSVDSGQRPLPYTVRVRSRQAH